MADGGMYVSGDDLLASLEGIGQRLERVMQRQERLSNGLDDVAGSLDEAAGDLDDAAGEFDGVAGEMDADSGKAWGGSRRTSRFNKGRDKHRSARSNVNASRSKMGPLRDSNSEVKSELKALRTDVNSILNSKDKKLAAYTREQIQTLTEISQTVTLVNSGAAAAVTTLQFTLPRDTYVQSLRLTVVTAAGAAATTIGCRVTALSICQSDNLIAGFNAPQFVNSTGVTPTSTQGILLPVATGVPIPHSIPVLRNLKSADPIAITLQNISAVSADGVVIGIEVVTIGQNKMVGITT